MPASSPGPLDRMESSDEHSESKVTVSFEGLPVPNVPPLPGEPTYSECQMPMPATHYSPLMLICDEGSGSGHGLSHVLEN